MLILRILNPVGKIFRYEGAANSQKLANFGNRTSSELRCRFGQRIRQFFVRRITTEIRPKFALRNITEFRYASLQRIHKRKLSDSSYTLRQTNHCRRRSEFEFNSQREFGNNSLPTSYRSRSEMKSVLKSSVRHRCTFAETSQIGLVCLRSRFVCEIN